MALKIQERHVYLILSLLFLMHLLTHPGCVIVKQELRVETLKARVEIQKCELGVQIHKLWAQTYELRVETCVLRLQMHQLQAQIHESLNLWQLK